MENKILIFLCLILFFFCNWLIPVTDPTENCYALTAIGLAHASTEIFGTISRYFFIGSFYWRAEFSASMNLL